MILIGYGPFIYYSQWHNTYLVYKLPKKVSQSYDTLLGINPDVYTYDAF